jgi:hypothetical protein
MQSEVSATSRGKKVKSASAPLTSPEAASPSAQVECFPSAGSVMKSSQTKGKEDSQLEKARQQIRYASCNVVLLLRIHHAS